MRREAIIEKFSQLYELCKKNEDQKIEQIFLNATDLLYFLKEEGVHIFVTHNIITINPEVFNFSHISQNRNGTLEYACWIKTEKETKDRKYETWEYFPYLQLFKEDTLTSTGGKVELSLEKGKNFFFGQWNDAQLEDLKQLVDSPNCPAQKRVESILAVKKIYFVLTIAYEILTKQWKADIKAMVDLWKKTEDKI